MHHQTGDDIGVFLTVCETGQFSAAASRLALSPSAVAKAIARLETRLQIKLFQRTTRSLNLTMEGRLYRDVCADARQKIGRAEEELQSAFSAPIGCVRISLPPLFGSRVVAPALYALCGRYPGLQLDISATTAILDPSRSDFDLVVRIGEPPDVTGLAARRLGTQKAVLCARASYLDKFGTPSTLEELATHRLIGEARGGRPAIWRFRTAEGRTSNLVPQSDCLLDGSLLVLSAVEAGHGIGVVPLWLVNDGLRTGRIRSIFADRVEADLPIHIIWPISSIVPARLRVVIDAIVAASRDFFDTSNR
jgi:DNA-binding transcriptional LysR family regulator